MVFGLAIIIGLPVAKPKENCASSSRSLEDKMADGSPRRRCVSRWGQSFDY